MLSMMAKSLEDEEEKVIEGDVIESLRTARLFEKEKEDKTFDRRYVFVRISAVLDRQNVSVRHKEVWRKDCKFAMLPAAGTAACTA